LAVGEALHPVSIVAGVRADARYAADPRLAVTTRVDDRTSSSLSSRHDASVLPAMLWEREPPRPVTGSHPLHAVHTIDTRHVSFARDTITPPSHWTHDACVKASHQALANTTPIAAHPRASDTVDLRSIAPVILERAWASAPPSFDRFPQPMSAVLPPPDLHAGTGNNPNDMVLVSATVHAVGRTDVSTRPLGAPPRQCQIAGNCTRPLKHGASHTLLIGAPRPLALSAVRNTAAPTLRAAGRGSSPGVRVPGAAFVSTPLIRTRPLLRLARPTQRAIASLLPAASTSTSAQALPRVLPGRLDVRVNLMQRAPEKHVVAVAPVLAAGHNTLQPIVDAPGAPAPNGAVALFIASSHASGRSPNSALPPPKPRRPRPALHCTGSRFELGDVLPRFISSHASIVDERRERVTRTGPISELPAARVDVSDPSTCAAGGPLPEKVFRTRTVTPAPPTPTAPDAGVRNIRASGVLPTEEGVRAPSHPEPDTRAPGSCDRVLAYLNQVRNDKGIVHHILQRIRALAYSSLHHAPTPCCVDLPLVREAERVSGQTKSSLRVFRVGMRVVDSTAHVWLDPSPALDVHATIGFQCDSVRVNCPLPTRDSLLMRGIRLDDVPTKGCPAFAIFLARSSQVMIITEAIKKDLNRLRVSRPMICDSLGATACSKCGFCNLSGHACPTRDAEWKRLRDAASSLTAYTATAV
tara:strand:- start:955 stop:3042 length:2088 start_codon:yes stop_codon:yes gene_type:complete